MSEERTGYLDGAVRSTLTRRQREVLGFLARWACDHTDPPTLREIAAHLGLSAISTVQGHLDALEHAGAIHRDYGHRRSIQLLPGARRHLDASMLEQVIDGAIIARIRAIPPQTNTAAGRLAHEQAMHRLAGQLGVALPPRHGESR